MWIMDLHSCTGAVKQHVRRWLFQSFSSKWSKDVQGQESILSIHCLYCTMMRRACFLCFLQEHDGTTVGLSKKPSICQAHRLGAEEFWRPSWADEALRRLAQSWAALAEHSCVVPTPGRCSQMSTNLCMIHMNPYDAYATCRHKAWCLRIFRSSANCTDNSIRRFLASWSLAQQA